MKGWMGGRRRRVAVEKRDPIARQRQFFARRREQLRQSNLQPPVPNINNTRTLLDNLRHSTRAPQRHTRQPDHRPRKPPKRPQHISADLLLLADPNALQSVASTRLTKRRRDDRERRREPIPHPPPQRTEEDASDLVRLQRLHDSHTTNNEIRIFQDDHEITPRFRRSTLPKNFLNSEQTGRETKLPSKRRSPYSPSQMHYPQPERSPKRFKAGYMAPSSSRREDYEETRLASLYRRETRAHCLDDVLRTPPRNKTRGHHFDNDGPHSPRHDGTAFDQINNTHLSPRRNKTALHPLDDPQMSPRQNTLRPDQLDGFRTPQRSPRLLGLDALRFDGSPRPHYESHIEESAAPRKELCEPRSAGHDEPELPLPSIVERISRHIESPRRGSDIDDAPSHERTPSFDSRILRRVPPSQKFPSIEIDSDRGSASSRENSKAQEYDQEHDSFQCILSREPFRLDELSAELLRLEYKMLNEPDQDVRTFSMIRRKSDRELKKNRFEKMHMHLARPTASKTRAPNDRESKENMALASNHSPLPCPTHVGGNRNVDQNDQTGDECRQDLAVSVSLERRNPVAEAAAPADSESNTRPRSSPG